MPQDTNTASGSADLPEARLFTKKPVTISATQWFKNGDHPQVRAIAPSDDLFFTGMGGAMLTGREKYGVIGTLESPNHLVTPGDWIITGVAGEHYACKPAIFEATYSPAALAAGQATAAQPGVVYAELPAPNYPKSGGFPGTFAEAQMRAFADATCALRASHGQALRLLTQKEKDSLGRRAEGMDGNEWDQWVQEKFAQVNGLKVQGGSYE